MKKFGHLRPAKTAAQLPASARPPVRIFLTLLLGAAGIALPILLHAILLPVWGAGTTLLFVVFLLSLLPATGVAFFCAGQSMLRMGYAMCIVIVAAVLSIGMTKARIFGTVPSLDAVAAPSRPAAAGFLLPQAAPRADLAQEVEVRVALPRNDMRGRPTTPSRLRGRFTVVPVVDPDWTPAEPVPVVAVLEHGPDGVTHEVPGAPWSAGRGVLRLLPDPLRDLAVQEALRKAGWMAAPHIVIGRWVADPRWARLDAAMPLLWLFAATLLSLTLVVLSRHPWIAARLDPVMEGPPPGGSLPVGRVILQGIVALTLPSLLALVLRHAEVDIAVTFLALGFALVPSLMITIGTSHKATPVGVMIAGVILVVTLPMGVAGRGARPNGDMPSLAGARWVDVQEAMIVLGVGWLLWAVIVIIGRLLQGRGGSGASR